ncbi:Ankyrin repeat protein 1 [Giardia muris]|uniref:Ankyrin repeat protein 1 n=1 Tax=Giardia muris TaxID=5742 RepID=A0A4Z1T1C8_GIAMU|nr:Ankyrin repeat protein 1 [Giardia muris]|eukprot:TNJ27723.1 Ankyrin repeat protein 1 [Giardia muris]
MACTFDEWLAAARNDDTNTICLNLEEYSRRTDEGGETALMAAIRAGSHSTIHLLAQDEAGVQNAEGLSALMIAAKLDDDDSCRLLASLEVELATPLGKSALIMAAECGSINSLHVLLPYRQRLADFSGQSAYVYAIRNTHLNCLTALVTHLQPSLEELQQLIRVAEQVGDDETVSYLHDFYETAQAMSPGTRPMRQTANSSMTGDTSIESDHEARSQEQQKLCERVTQLTASLTASLSQLCGNRSAPGEAGLRAEFAEKNAKGDEIDLEQASHTEPDSEYLRMQIVHDQELDGEGSEPAPTYTQLQKELSEKNALILELETKVDIYRANAATAVAAAGSDGEDRLREALEEISTLRLQLDRAQCDHWSSLVENGTDSDAAAIKTELRKYQDRCESLEAQVATLEAKNRYLRTSVLEQENERENTSTAAPVTPVIKYESILEYLNANPDDSERLGRVLLERHPSTEDHQPCREQVSTLETQVERLDSQLQDANRVIAGLREELEGCREQLSATPAKIAAAEAARCELAARNDSLAEEIMHLRTQLQAANENTQVERSTLEALQDEVAESREVIREKDNELIKLRNMIDIEADAHRADLERAREDTQDQVQTLLKKIQSCDSYEDLLHAVGIAEPEARRILHRQQQVDADNRKAQSPPELQPFDGQPMNPIERLQAFEAAHGTGGAGSDAERLAKMEVEMSKYQQMVLQLESINSQREEQLRTLERTVRTMTDREAVMTDQISQLQTQPIQTHDDEAWTGSSQQQHQQYQHQHHKPPPQQQQRPVSRPSNPHLAISGPLDHGAQRFTPPGSSLMHQPPLNSSRMASRASSTRSYAPSLHRAAYEEVLMDLLPRIPLPGTTPLMEAVINDSLGAVLDNLTYARKIRSDGATALMLAAYLNHVPIVEKLAPIECGICGPADMTAMEIALRRGNYSSAEVLRRFEGADTTRVSRYHNKRCSDLMAAVQANDIVQVWSLIPLQAKIQDWHGKTALMHAIERRHSLCTHMLAYVEAGIQDRNGMTALMYAAIQGDVEVAELLVEKERGMVGRWHELLPSRFTALALACYYGKIDCVRLLLPYESNIRDSAGRSPTYYVRYCNANVPPQTKIELQNICAGVAE